MAESRKTVTIVFTDVTGSTALGEQTDPEVMRHVMARYFEEMRAVLEKHGGTVEKFIGDAVMAVFGIPIVHEDDALRAVRAAAEMRERLRALNEEFTRERGIRITVRTGVNTGEVVAGDPSAGQAFATGDAVNVAARLEQGAEPGEILLGPLTHQLVSGAVLAQRLEPLELKGKAQGVEAWRLAKVLPDVPAYTRRIDAPFIGREEELSAIRSALDRACEEGRPELVTVAALAGVGKSRLVRELAVSVRETSSVVVGRCLAYGEGITYWPLAEIVHHVAGEEVAVGLAEALRSEDDARAISAHLSSAVGVGQTPSRSEEIAWATRRLFEILAAEQPLVVVLDDVHWAEPTFLDLVEYVFGFARAPILLLCIARPDLFETRPSWAIPRPHATTILLEPLPEPLSGELLDALLGGEEISDSLRQRIVEQSEGNPLFVEQMLAHLKEVNDGGSTVPPSMEALLAARIDSLSPSERAVVERGSVEGRLFHRGAVAAMLPENGGSDVSSHLMNLVRKELIRPDRAELPGDDGFRFAHILVRDAAYASIPKSNRADLHERFANWLDSSARATEFAEIIGYHLERSVRYSEELGRLDDRQRELGQRAADRLTNAGRRAAVRGDVAAAANLLERARALIAPGDPEWWSSLPDLVQIYVNSGALGRAGDLIGSALESAETEHQRAIAEILEVRLRVMSEPEDAAERAVDAARRTIPVFENAEDHVGLINAWSLLHEIHWQRGQLARSEADAKEALVYAERIGDVRAMAGLRSMIGAARAFGMTPLSEAVRWGEQELDWAREFGVRWHEAMVLIGVGAMRNMSQGDKGGLAMISEGQAMLDDLGMRITGAAIVANWADQLEDPGEAEVELRKAYDTLKEAGERGFLSTVAARLADAIYKQDRLDEASVLTDESQAAGAADDMSTQVAVRRVRAKILARRGHHEDAQILARRAVELAQGTEYYQLWTEALTDLAEVLQLGDLEHEAASTLEDVLALYRRKGQRLGVDLVQARLAELQSSGSPSQ